MIITAVLSEKAKEKVAKILLQAAFFNLFLVAVLGLTLRSTPLLDRFPFVYKNLLHGHSHFAFGGWILPVLIALVMKAFPELTGRIAAKHWRTISVLTLLSAYGMLVFFPLYGYKGISIFFSTLSIAATVYFAVVVWRAVKGQSLTVAHRFLIWGLIYAVVSSLGPFATVPLIVTGKQGTPLYFDLIYFYLHFQYNGFFTFIVLALLYRNLQTKSTKVFRLMNLACVPAYALSVLWHQPSFVFNIIGGVAAVLQLAALYFLWLDVKKTGLSILLSFSLCAFALKIFLQAAGAFPAVAVMAYDVRNFVIAYLHLVLLGFISMSVFAAIAKSIEQKKLFRFGIGLFLFSFFTTETLLLFQALFAAKLLQVVIPSTSQLLFVFSLPFAAGALLMAIAVSKSSHSIASYKSFLLNERSANNSGSTIQASITASV
ncbi:hypothetical protein [Flavisolibacter ginsenosidimutans]|uniref:Cytochrome C oxidase subunit I n=1 Tax=Flavisolibacter ginsenosidimutans TaxID=661481 RepID=A0A5B8UGF1_9BACT|nr:hypothetical protein [Flavisolibacter ginsenosidimutans]QEC55445.1 hypothetical protein FSB75_05845 [Flavisolibacter ginsenosidimutans]